MSAVVLMVVIIGLGFYFFAAIGTVRADRALAKEREQVRDIVEQLNSKGSQLHYLDLKGRTTRFVAGLLKLHIVQ